MDKMHLRELKPCTVCGTGTLYACADCSINSAGTVRPRVCTNPACRDEHERSVHSEQSDV